MGRGVALEYDCDVFTKTTEHAAIFAFSEFIAQLLFNVV
jgi:hypothetical protein